MAPLQSSVELVHPPSTQLSDCTTVSVIVLVAKFDDSNVPVHDPERSANGPAVGEDAGAELELDLHPLAIQATTAAPTRRLRVRTTGNDHNAGRVSSEQAVC
jgi:hypothetical protein